MQQCIKHIQHFHGVSLSRHQDLPSWLISNLTILPVKIICFTSVIFFLSSQFTHLMASLAYKDTSVTYRLHLSRLTSKLVSKIYVNLNCQPFRVNRNYSGMTRIGLQWGLGIYRDDVFIVGNIWAIIPDALV